MSFLISRRQLTLIIGVSLVVMVTFGFLGMMAINNPAYESIRHLFETKHRQNITTWYTAILFLVAALLAGLISWHQYQRQAQNLRYWVGTVVILLLLSFDGVTEFYGLIVVSQYDPERAGLLFGWFLPTAVVIGLMVIVYVPFVRGLPDEIRLRYVVSLLLVVASGIAVSVINRLYFPPEYELLSTLQLLEEVSASRLRVYILLITFFQAIQWIGAAMMIDVLLRFLNQHTRFRIEFVPQSAANI